jgi:hypothetical protein
MSQDNRYHAIYFLSYFTIKQCSCDDYQLLNAVDQYVIYYAPRIIKGERFDDTVGLETDVCGPVYQINMVDWNI